MFVEDGYADVHMEHVNDSYYRVGFGNGSRYTSATPTLRVPECEFELYFTSLLS